VLAVGLVAGHGGKDGQEHESLLAAHDRFGTLALGKSEIAERSQVELVSSGYAHAGNPGYAAAHAESSSEATHSLGRQCPRCSGEQRRIRVRQYSERAYLRRYSRRGDGAHIDPR